jgi:hypothetical protein
VKETATEAEGAKVLEAERSRSNQHTNSRKEEIKVNGSESQVGVGKVLKRELIRSHFDLGKASALPRAENTVVKVQRNRSTEAKQLKKNRLDL